MADRGFIVQPTYRVEAGRPVVHLFGRLANGEPFLVRDDRDTPFFYIAASDADRARRLGVGSLSPTRLRTFDDREVLRVDLRLPSDAPPLRDRLVESGIACYEADVRFARRFLIRRGIRGSVEIHGPWSRHAALGRVYENPGLRNVAHDQLVTSPDPPLRLLSIDIETDPRTDRLLSIALVGCDAHEVLLLTPRGFEVPRGAVPFATERDLIGAFVERMRQLDPDILTGWNVIDFDLRFLAKVAERQRLRLALGRQGGSLRLRPSRVPWGSTEASLEGRVVLDGVILLRSSFVTMERYSLDFVSRQVLGEGKLMSGDDRVAEILETFENDRQRFVDYNLQDARLVLDILDELALIDLAMERSRLTGLPVDRVSGSIAAFDFLYLEALQKRRRVAPSVGAREDEGASNLGGHVLEPEAGIYQNVLVCDFKSLYPSLIRTFQIDPLGYLSDPRPGDDPIVAPNGAAFRRRAGILPGLLDELFPRREEAKQAGDQVASHAIKILMNSFYGVLGASGCRFCEPRMASAITAFGREILLWSKARIESYGPRVLYGDTDSLFILSGREDPDEAEALGRRLVARLNHDLTAHVDATWRVESKLELELERLYLQLHLPSMRHGRGGARKRYAGLVRRGEDTEIVFTGMEVVRRDWTELAKRVQRELYHRLFHSQPVDDYLSLVVANLRQGRLDDLLTYRKGLGKSLDAYTSTTPPHVAAARKLSRKPGRVIDYVMTVQGAEPAEEQRSGFDYEHYVQKQIRPVAEPILELLDLDFDFVIGDDAQLSLF